MPDVFKVTVNWAVPKAGIAKSRHFFNGPMDAITAQAACNDVRVFYNALTQYLRTNWTLTVQPICQSYDIQTGDANGEVTVATPPAPVVGFAGSTTNWVSGVGACLFWGTGQFREGRKVRGRTYLTPLCLFSETEGGYSTGFSNAVVAAGNTLCASAASDLVVWHRRFDGNTPPTQIGGEALLAIGAALGNAPSRRVSRQK